MTFLEHGASERLKGLWHLGGLIFAGGAMLYNVAAYLQRRDTHLIVNATAYAALTALEIQKVKHHWP